MAADSLVSGSGLGTFSINNKTATGRLPFMVSEEAEVGDLIEITFSVSDSGGQRTDGVISVRVGEWGEQSIVIAADTVADGAQLYSSLTVDNANINH